MQRDELIRLRRKYIEQCFAGLNDRQREAALRTEGPLLILAGAGSGKTTVIVNRICNLIRFGSAYESDYLSPALNDAAAERLKTAVACKTPLSPEDERLLRAGDAGPFNLLAITFTNKAASEMKSRIIAQCGEPGEDVLASTFHSACVRFLRHDITHIGMSRSFSIYDDDDSKRLMKQVYAAENVDDRMFPIKTALSRISRLKDSMTSPEKAAEQASDPQARLTARLYAAYQRALREASALDFDDIIYDTVKLLSENAEVRDYYRRRFSYVLVDEYQDTSYAQYRLVELLGGGKNNVCVVGDDDQSIYRFRGATIENILNFEQYFKGARVIRLEQNYRSTGNILAAANEIISNNTSRKGKTLWTDKDSGDRIQVYVADDEQDEAAQLVASITSNVQKRGAHLCDHAVLYRMNAQSNAIETYFARAGLPYRIVGGQRFYDRAEIKDILAYMCVVSNPRDNVRLMRIINRPARKIGAATIDAVSRIADGLGVPALEVLRDAQNYPELSRSLSPLKSFYSLYEKLCSLAESESLPQFVTELIEQTGYRAMLEAEGDDGAARLENVNELRSSVESYCASTETPTLEEFLEQVALISSIDMMDSDADRVTLMTLHCAKGLEFDYVYIVGLEEEIFPSSMAMYSTQDLEEERRLMYVGVTRARKELTLSCAASRMLFGQTRRNRPSRFLAEFDNKLAAVRESGYSLRRQLTPTAAAPQTSFGGVGMQSRPTTGAHAASGAAGLELAKGDRVHHKVFGDGTVLALTPVGNDVLVEIDFDSRGVKKTMKNYAPLTKL